MARAPENDMIEPIGMDLMRKSTAGFGEGNLDIQILEGPELPDLAALVAQAYPGEVRAPVPSASSSCHVRGACRRLNLNSSWLCDDIEAAFHAFLTCFELEEANLIIEVTERRMCPQFHCDNLHVRIVKTYYGPTTEFIYRDRPHEIHSVPLGSTVLLKGRVHPTHGDTIHHRSPAVPPGSKRLCVIADY